MKHAAKQSLVAILVVGVGPGDPSYMTGQVATLLESADVVATLGSLDPVLGDVDR